MKKKLCTVITAAMVAGAAMTACSSKPAETTATESVVETTAESTAEETTVEESSAEETTAEESAENAENTAETKKAVSDDISEEELTELYRAYGESLQSIIEDKNMDELAVLLGYPCYIGIDNGVTVNNEEEFLALDADKVFTDELIAAVKNADLDAIETSEAGFVIGDPSGKPNVTIGLDANKVIGITGINY